MNAIDLTTTIVMPPAAPGGRERMTTEVMSPDAIRHLRERMNLSQAKLAARLGVQTTTVWRWEHGESRPRRGQAAALRALDGQIVHAAAIEDDEMPDLIRRRPRDAFEEAVFTAVLRAHLRDWLPDAVGITVPEDGVWGFVLTRARPSRRVADGAIAIDGLVDERPAGLGLGLDLDDTIVGRIWLAERLHPASPPSRVEIVWQLGSQTNTWPAPPVLDWDQPNPAGPWSTPRPPAVRDRAESRMNAEPAHRRGPARLVAV